MRSRKHKTKQGFTLLEILLSVALLSAIVSIGMPLYQSFQVRNDLEIAVVTMANAVRRASTLARASDGDASWGVRTATGSITLFKGTSYAARDAAYDEDFSVPTSLSFSGTSEYVFSRFTGFPGASGSTTITASINETRTLTVSAKGMVNY